MITNELYVQNKFSIIMRLKKIPIRVGFQTLQWSKTLSYSIHNPSAIPTDSKFKVYPEVNHFFTVAIHPQISPRFFQCLELITLSLLTLVLQVLSSQAHFCLSENRKRQRAHVALFIHFGVLTLSNALLAILLFFLDPAFP